MKKIHEECYKDTGVDVELIKHIKTGDYKGDGTDLECFPKCFFLKAGFMNDKGEVLIDVMKEALNTEENPEKLIKVVENCSAKTGKDLCETSFMHYKCWWDETRTENLLPKLFTM